MIKTTNPRMHDMENCGLQQKSDHDETGHSVSETLVSNASNVSRSVSIAQCSEWMGCIIESSR